MYEAILQITIYLAMVLSPVLIPVTAHGIHIVRDRRQSYPQRGAVHLPRVAAPRRLAVRGLAPAAA